MKCDFCNKEFEEKEIQESHDIPCYLFEGNRQGRKNQADKFGRHWLCKKCHKEYERRLGSFLRKQAREFALIYFKEETKEDDSIQKL